MSTRFHPFALLILIAAPGGGSVEPAREGVPSGPLSVMTDKGQVEGALLGSTRAFVGIP